MISVLIPSRGRPHKLEECAKSLLALAADPKSVEIICRVDNDDPTLPDYRKIEGVTLISGPRMEGYARNDKLIEECASESTGDVLMQAVDTMRMRTPGWDGVITEAMAQAPHGVAAAFPSVLPKGAYRFSFPTITRRLYELCGMFCLGGDPSVDRCWEAFADCLKCEVKIDVVVEHNELRNTPREDATASESQPFYRELEKNWEQRHEEHRRIGAEYAEKVRMMTEERLPRIRVYSIMRNEIKILPYFLRYYERFAESIVVYDDDSDDGTTEYLKSRKKVEVRKPPKPFIDDGMFAKLFSNCYKEDRSYEWVMCVDADEFFWTPNVLKSLNRAKEKNINVLMCTGYEMKSMRFPTTRGQITDEIKTGNLAGWSGGNTKGCVFNPQIDLTYEAGRHSLSAPGCFSDREYRLLHYRDMSYQYYLWHHRRDAARLDPKRACLEWGKHNYEPLTEEQFIKHVAKAGIVIS